MFHHIKGKVTHTGLDYAVIEAGGVGFKLYTSLATKNRIQLDADATMYTYLHVREGIMDLYGFLSEEELNTFQLLISVSGVGPKAAISVLSSITAADFALAVVTNNVKEITKAQGVGPKMAQRIILDLKDKVKAEDLLVAADAVPAAGDASGLSGFDEAAREAAEALTALGYSAGEASQAVRKAAAEGMTAEEILKASLKYLAF